MKKKKSGWDVRLDTLTLSLRQEFIQVTHDRETLMNLNLQVDDMKDQAAQLSWTIGQQRYILQQAMDQESATDNTYNFLALSSTLHSVTFLPSYNRLGDKVTFFQSLVCHLRSDPQLLASLLCHGQEGKNTFHVVRTVMSSIYGDCLLQQDRTLCLSLVHHLMSMQLGPSCLNPRKLLKNSNTALTRVMKLLTDSLSSAQIFLVSALRDPVMETLIQEDGYLDMDVDRAISQFSKQERDKLFGSSSSPDHHVRITQYKEKAKDKLFLLVTKFVHSIHDSLFCFPDELKQVVQHLDIVLNRLPSLTPKDVHTICTDLVFGSFLCYVLVNPELYNIVDMHVTKVARFNLMHIAQILQVLAMSRFNPPDGRFQELTTRLKDHNLPFVLDVILDRVHQPLISVDEPPIVPPPLIPIVPDGAIGGAGGGSGDGTVDAPHGGGDPTPRLPEDEDESPEQEEVPPYLARSSILISEMDLYSLASYVNRVTPSIPDEVSRNKLHDLMVGCPVLPDVSSWDPFASTSPEENEKPEAAAVKVTTPAPETKRRTLFNKVRKVRVTDASPSGVPPTSPDPMDSHVSTPSMTSRPSVTGLKEVLMIPIISPSDSHPKPGLIHEDKFMEQESLRKHRMKQLMDSCFNDPGPHGSNNGPSGSNSGEKRTRFSQDQESIGTSDNLEAISEAASLHSESESSLDTENENDLNDNLSDMVSANVSSGRGSPNVSGRDTPSSHSDDEPDGGSVPVGPSPSMGLSGGPGSGSSRNITPRGGSARKILRPQPALNNIPVERPHRTGTQNDIEGKFGKFDCPQSSTTLSVDETKSLLSDTWSTDVLASSDTEGIEQNADLMAAAAAAVAQVGGLSPPPLLIPGLNPPPTMNSGFHNQPLINLNQGSPGMGPPTGHPGLGSSGGGGGGDGGPSGGVGGSGRNNHHNHHQNGNRSNSSNRGGSGHKDSNNLGGGGGGGGGDHGPGNGGGSVPKESVDVTKGSASDSCPSTDRMTSQSSIKRKMRRVLCMVDAHGACMAFLTKGAARSYCNRVDRGSCWSSCGCKEGPYCNLMKLLKLLMVEAKHVDNGTQLVAVQEGIRSLEHMDNKGVMHLLKCLQEDHKKRCTYWSYLDRSKHVLLSSVNHYTCVTKQLDRNEQNMVRNLVIIWVRQFLNKRQHELVQFAAGFPRLSAADEKGMAVDEFLNKMTTSMQADAAWTLASESQADLAKQVVEQTVMSYIYYFALYPNGEGDMGRDTIFHDHMNRLSQVVTPTSSYLNIAPMYSSECPWPSAQQQIATINALKTPAEKVACVTTTCTMIVNLLSLASDRPPAADDLIPVLVYVILKANPPSLLSTVQYVDTFYSRHLKGQDSYWWTLFHSAVNFIKTMDY